MRDTGPGARGMGDRVHKELRNPLEHSWANAPIKPQKRPASMQGAGMQRGVNQRAGKSSLYADIGRLRQQAKNYIDK